MNTKQLINRLLNGLTPIGAFAFMIRDVWRDIISRGVSVREVSKQMVIIGVRSIPIVALTSLFTGMVLALQTAYGLHRFGAKNYVGNIVSLAQIRELGPVLAAVMLCGRVGAGIAAELASMVVTEQVDAMRALGANPIRKLVSPKIVAGLIAVPLLVVISDLIGIYGGLFVGVYDLNITAYTFYRSIMYTVKIRDVFDGLIKSVVFGFLLVGIACFKGLRTKGGTEGVGRTTTEAVVTSSIMVFVSDVLMTKLLLLIG